jgi:outer membrane receptor protein involved in Fe transport
MSLALLLYIHARAQGGGTLEGEVTDPRGLAVAAAHVSVSNSQGKTERTTRTDRAGRFTVSPLPPGAYEIKIVADGFESANIRVELQAGATRQLTVTLSVARLTDTITVTPTRTEQKLADVPASVTILDRQEISQSASYTVDDLLRQRPAFSLFRRTSSLVAHPTTQGVSLRGLGPSGVSRTLVMLDNVPYNDPFGGWVYWSSIPTETVERIEVVESGGSNLYGNYASGGVINIITLKPEEKTLRLTGQYGNRNTSRFDGLASHMFGRLGVALEGSAFRTDGYKITAPRERGTIDTNADSKNESLTGKLNYRLPNASFFLKGSFFDERRNNGTRLQKNSTIAKSLNGGLNLRTHDGSDWQFLLFSDFRTFHSTFTEVAASRNSERLTLLQRVPTNSFGSSLQWSKPVSSSHVLSAGVDYRWVDGESDEQVVGTTGSIIRFRVSGGTQRSLGGFLQGFFAPVARLRASLSARVDHWRNFDATNRERVPPAEAVTISNFREKSNTLLSPKAALLYHVTNQVSVWGSTTWGFRAPTLNELYRQFRAGNTLTLANEQLGPERVLGSEAGVRVSVRDNLFFHTTGFWNRVKGSVSNVTSSVTPALITQQRQNLGRTRVWGIESEIEYRPSHRWSLGGAYLFDDATVRKFPVNRLIVGNRIPQVPKHRFTLQTRYTNPALINFSVQGRFVGTQFEDDRNRLRLEEFFVVDMMASRALGRFLETFVSIENFFDKEYAVGKTPFTTLGTPFLIHGGVRLRLSAR